MTSAEAQAMSPVELLDASDRLMVAGLPNMQGLWPRAVAFLLRLALETAVDEFWRTAAPGMTTCSRRAQLACLHAFTDRETAAKVSAAWGALSSACHYHAYDLGPTAWELRSWYDTVRQIGVLLRTTAQASQPPSSEAPRQKGSTQP